MGDCYISQVTNVVEVRFIDMFYILNVRRSAIYFRNPQPRHNCLLDEGCKVDRPMANHYFAEALSYELEFHPWKNISYH